jgi:hypothetical protein
MLPTPWLECGAYLLHVCGAEWIEREVMANFWGGFSPSSPYTPPLHASWMLLLELVSQSTNHLPFPTHPCALPFTANPAPFSRPAFSAPLCPSGLMHLSHRQCFGCSRRHTFASHAVSDPGCDSSCGRLVIFIAELSELAPLGVFRLYVSESLHPALLLSRLPSSLIWSAPRLVCARGPRLYIPSQSCVYCFSCAPYLTTRDRAGVGDGHQLKPTLCLFAYCAYHSAS